jgi:hypothetical protein
VSAGQICRTASGESRIAQAVSAKFEPSWSFSETVSRKMALARYALGGLPNKIKLFDTEVL